MGILKVDNMDAETHILINKILLSALQLDQDKYAMRRFIVHQLNLYDLNTKVSIADIVKIFGDIILSINTLSICKPNSLPSLYTDMHTLNFDKLVPKIYGLSYNRNLKYRFNIVTHKIKHERIFLHKFIKQYTVIKFDNTLNKLHIKDH